MRKLLIIISCALIFCSCNAVDSHSKKHFENGERAFNLTRDETQGKIIEFFNRSGIPVRILEKSPGEIFAEETFDREQAQKYTDFNPDTANARIISGRERMLIYINHDSNITRVSIKTFMTGTISYLKFEFKSVERITKEISCPSSGLREKELLDFIGQGKNSAGAYNGATSPDKLKKLIAGGNYSAFYSHS